jgi:putative transposase
MGMTGQEGDAELTRTSLQDAVKRRNPRPGLIFQTDRGIEYGAYEPNPFP